MIDLSLLKRNIIRSKNEFTITTAYGVFQIEEGQELTIKSVISFEIELRDESGEIIPFGIIVEEFPPVVILSPAILDNFEDATEIDFDRIRKWFDHSKQKINKRTL